VKIPKNSSSSYFVASGLIGIPNLTALTGLLIVIFGSGFFSSK
jgi:hypothetical protein